ncbi:pilus assembly protein [Moritella sp. F3]|uniref:pilus assembly protein n=1 Tax=Moritella sp. F3 TaxID=2718882 RepID=UPI0018E19BE2|nr:PilC/PilY family type IV pilus protein [Moritella sp. F3]GIC77951.1 type IV pili system adhesin PilY [Moritella sp. F1]GIC82360.1 type IV pili system adhesin PilY [Moritella sp. F3]
MKRIFKTASAILAVILGCSVHADETEIYEASIDNKPQVLIILDTSRHMNNNTTFPVPERYDPNIDYSDPASNNIEKFFEDRFTSQHFYWRNYDEIKDLASFETLAEIASKDNISPSDSVLYSDFVTTIPIIDDEKKRKYKYMNCSSAVFDMSGELGAYSDHVRQWKGIGFFGIGAKYWSETIGPKHELNSPKIDCKTDMDLNNPHNPGAEGAAFFAIEDEETGLQDSTFYQGYPQNGVNIPYGYQNGSNPAKDLSFSGGGSADQAYLYSDNLVDWAALKKAGTDSIELSFLNVAKKVVLDVMLETPEVKSGLEIFNLNNTVIEQLDLADNHGGRIISGIKSYDTLDYKANLQGYKDSVSLIRSKVSGITTSSDARSALCESLYEGYRYLYGQDVWFGDDEAFFPYPKRDKSIETAGKEYISPLDWTKTCQTEAYIIIVTAGYKETDNDSDRFITCQNHDGEANPQIDTLTAELLTDQPELKLLDDSDPRSLSDTAHAARTVETTMESKFGFLSDCQVENKLPQLAHYLYNNDMNGDDSDGKQHIATYTVGIDVLDGSKALLEKTAKSGGGEFFNAETATELREKLKLVLGDIVARQKSTTATVTTSINANNSTQSDKAVYFTMFEPAQSSKWNGNLKKLVIENGVLNAWDMQASLATSTNLTPALSSTNGVFFADGLYSGWSNSPGLDAVEVGGVVEAFNRRDVSIPRKVYVNNGSDSVLCEITLDNLKVVLGVKTGTCINSDSAAPPSTPPDSEDVIEAQNIALAALLDVDVEALSATIRWLNGLNDTGTAFRDDIFGDPMHSAPLVVKYDDVSRIFIGTNAGFFHAFKDNGNAVEEEWAFIPVDLLKSAISLRYDSTIADRVYGVDSTAVDAEYGDSKHIITFGLRRGGSAYYSFNVDKGLISGSTEKLTLHWIMKNTGTGDFAKLGQTWSVPTVTKVYRGFEHELNSNPVLIFGGGYDIGKDNCGINGSTVCGDTLGRGVYIVDIKDKSVVSSFVFSEECDEAQWDCITDSIASKLSVLDSDGDGYLDRIYAADTGGNIYRIDTPNTYSGHDKTTVDTGGWSLRLIAQLGDKQIGASDRRFFTAPSIVRAVNQNRRAYDGLLIGSGDITHPNSNKVTEDYMFNIKDLDLTPVVWVASGEVDPSIYSVAAKVRETPLQFDDLTLVDPDVVTDSNDAGWAYHLTKDKGQKILGNAVVIDGVVNFNSYSPFSSTVVVNNGLECLLAQTGNSHFYQVNLNTGELKTYKKLENVIAKDLSIHSENNSYNAPLLRLLGAGKGDRNTLEGVSTSTGTIDTEVTLSPRPIYRYFNEAVQ